MAITKIDGEKQIKDTTIKNAQVATAAGIETTKLADGANIIMRDGSVPFTGTVNAGSNRVTDVADPVSGTDAVNRGYMDRTYLRIEKIVKREAPVQSPDGERYDFSLANAVVANSEQVYLNGVLQEPGIDSDYTMNASGGVVTFGIAPAAEDVIRVTYVKV